MFGLEIAVHDDGSAVLPPVGTLPRSDSGSLEGNSHPLSELIHWHIQIYPRLRTGRAEKGKIPLLWFPSIVAEAIPFQQL